MHNLGHRIPPPPQNRVYLFIFCANADFRQVISIQEAQNARTAVSCSVACWIATVHGRLEATEGDYRGVLVL